MTSIACDMAVAPLVSPNRAPVVQRGKTMTDNGRRGYFSLVHENFESKDTEPLTRDRDRSELSTPLWCGGRSVKDWCAVET